MLMFYKKKMYTFNCFPYVKIKRLIDLTVWQDRLPRFLKKITFILLAFLAKPVHRYFFFFLREILHQRAMIVSTTHSNLIVLLLIP